MNHNRGDLLPNKHYASDLRERVKILLQYSVNVQSLDISLRPQRWGCMLSSLTWHAVGAFFAFVVADLPGWACEVSASFAI